ncbi:hypothetical protein EMIHUDRAFT_207284 [Emiliania huxleyi CCMP1516]|uniref:Uncharacterized protein n=2 Tax=Emiliania huxleyi TaxID=2903 RepID=A0A0D3JF70_EMIH1|nr:hypothetical protein EMIHUDRAFT_207284 [Emiliania huxleyi CCMP1516]EOD22155.1 hypothetical protein EMIHUDRAFT_207284 [Emiliania huxleyi CCMP1516]|eukprot:XP_005774584.1 hypothetical protein EMIHUDRAFT_207284 [Emiliania huxleyi CCMP1516]
MMSEADRALGVASAADSSSLETESSVCGSSWLATRATARSMARGSTRLGATPNAGHTTGPSPSSAVLAVPDVDGWMGSLGSSTGATLGALCRSWGSLRQQSSSAPSPSPPADDDDAVGAIRALANCRFVLRRGSG